MISFSAYLGDSSISGPFISFFRIEYVSAERSLARVLARNMAGPRFSKPASAAACYRAKRWN